MTPQEIKEQIDALNHQLETIMTPEIFMLNYKIRDINKQITDLQELCAHGEVDADGCCIYCNKKIGE